MLRSITIHKLPSCCHCDFCNRVYLLLNHPREPNSQHQQLPWQVVMIDASLTLSQSPFAAWLFFLPVVQKSDNHPLRFPRLEVQLKKDKWWSAVLIQNNRHSFDNLTIHQPCWIIVWGSLLLTWGLETGGDRLWSGLFGAPMDKEPRLFPRSSYK